MRSYPGILDQAGFSTLEMLIAMAIFILAISAVVGLSYGSQSMIVDSQAGAEALNIAQDLLEKLRADSRNDFNLVNPVSATSTADGFTASVGVIQADYFTKNVTAMVSWPEDGGRHGNTKLSARVTNFNDAVGGDTCSSILLDSTGNPNVAAWKTPQIKSTFSDFTLYGVSADHYSVTDLDAYEGKLYVTVNNSNAATSTVPTFFVFDISANTINPIAGDFVDNDPAIKSGLNAVAVAEDPEITGKIYAYVASGSSQKFQVIDVSGASPQIIAIHPGLTAASGVGNSIFYKDGYVYLGLKSSTSGPEFHIIDVHKSKPTSPLEIGHWPQSGSLRHDINAIYVRGRYAYLATPDSNNLIVLDVSDASAPKEVGSFNMNSVDGSVNNGKSIALVGDKLYLGRTQAVGGINGLKFYILDGSNPATATIPIAGSFLGINKSIDGVIVRGKSEPVNSSSFPALAFLLLPAEIKILNVSNPAAITLWADRSFGSGAYGSSDYEPVFDCEGNNFFVGSNDSGNNGYLSLIAP